MGEVLGVFFYDFIDIVIFIIDWRGFVCCCFLIWWCRFKMGRCWKFFLFSLGLCRSRWWRLWLFLCWFFWLVLSVVLLIFMILVCWCFFWWVGIMWSILRMWMLFFCCRVLLMGRILWVWFLGLWMFRRWLLNRFLGWLVLVRICCGWWCRWWLVLWLVVWLRKWVGNIRVWLISGWFWIWWWGWWCNGWRLWVLYLSWRSLSWLKIFFCKWCRWWWVV